MIFFQGDEDAVVPPNQTEAMVDALRRNGNAVGYFLFAGEQHGFRKAGNIQRSLDAELYFYAIEVFRNGIDVLDRSHTGAGAGASHRLRHFAFAAACRPAVCHTIVRRSIARANVSNRIDSSRIITIAPNTCGESRMVR